MERVWLCVLIPLTFTTWIRSYLRRADLNQDGKMSYDEVQHLLKMINIDLNEQYARTLFRVRLCVCVGVAACVYSWSIWLELLLKLVFDFKTFFSAMFVFLQSVIYLILKVLINFSSHRMMY